MARQTNAFRAIEEKVYRGWRDNLSVLHQILRDSSLDLNAHRDTIQAMAMHVMVDTQTYWNKREKCGLLTGGLPGSASTSSSP